MQFGLPPQAYANMYSQNLTAQQQQQYKTAPANVQHAFEDAAQMVSHEQQSQQAMYTAQQQPQQQQQQPLYGAGDYANAAPPASAYTQPQQQMYAQQQQQQQQQQAAMYAQQQQQQQQQVPYAPQAPYPPRPAPMSDDVLRMTEVQLVTDDQRHGLCTHPSVPRLRLEEVAADMDSRPPAPAHIVTTTRRAVRPTLNALPATSDLVSALALPVALHVRPFAEPRVVDVNFAEVDNVMVRCQRCMAYITPYTTFTHNGQRWICILCRTINDVSSNYYCPIDQRTGLRQDVHTRGELTHCSVDFLATREFLRREPARPVMLVMLDCTHNAVASGLLASMCAGALAALERIVHGDNDNNDGDSNNNNNNNNDEQQQQQDASALHMCVMAYDATVYFFNLRAGLSAPQMIAAPDIVHDVRAMNDAFKLDAIELPCPIKELVVSVKEGYALLREVFSKLPTLFAHTTQVDSAFAPAVTAALTVLDQTGGKVLASVASLPSLGDGKLRHRAEVAGKLAGSAKEHTAFAPATDWYKQRALVCSNRSVSFDLFVRGSSSSGSGAGGNSSSSDVDLASIVPLARYTSGNVYYATTLTMSGMAAQLEHALTRHTAFEAVMRVRTSPGLSVSNCYGHCLVRQPEYMALPVTDEDACYTIELTIGPYFNAKYAYVQIAVIHTTRARERRVRVHTVQLPVASTLTRALNAVNGIGLATYWMRMGIDEATRSTLAQARQKVTAALTAALKLACNEARKQQLPLGPGRLYLLTSMRYVPQILCGFLRSAAIGAPLGGGTSGSSSAPAAIVSADERVAHMARIYSAAPEAMLSRCVSWWYKIALPYDHIDNLPSPTYASMRSLLRNGVFLLNLGHAVVLWCGSEANVAVAQALGLQPLPSMLEKASEMASYAPEQLTALRARTDALIWQQRQFNRPAFAAEVMLYSDVTQPRLDSELARACVEDAVAALPSYSAFLTTLWKNTMMTA